MDDKRYAVLIDSDNISSKYISNILDEMTKYGVITYKRIYGDWTSPQAGKWKKELMENSITPIQQFRNTVGKNATDSTLIIDAMDILYTKNVDGFCIVSSDGDFTRLASRLRESGMEVIGMVENGEINWDLLAETTRTAIRFLDNVIAVNNYPLPQISEMVQNNRKIGLGVMGWADMLMKLGLSYASEEGTKLAGQVMEFIDYESKCESIELSKERGKFNNFVGSIYDGKDFLYNKYKGKSAGKISDEQWKELDAQIAKFGIRNATTTCIAPTGTISMIASASGGVEPLFGLVFSRLIMDGTEMFEVNPIFKDYAVEHGFYSEELMKEIAKTGSIAHVDGVSEEVKHIFVTAHDVSPYWHVKMQAAFQLHTDNAVSKTVNFEEHATRKDIEEAYILAYENNLKGITVYRNNSRQFQPMNLDDKKKSEETKVEETVVEEASEEPTGEIKTVKCPECGNEIQMAEGCFICLKCGYSGCS